MEKEIEAEVIDINYSLEIGDIVLIQNGGHGFVDQDINKYVQVVDYGDYYGTAGVKVVEYDEPFVTKNHGNGQGVVGYGSFGENPLILFNIHEEHVVDEEHTVVAVGSKEVADKILGIGSSALDKQVSGNHYKGCKIQPIEYIHANGLDYFQGNVIKYVTRYKDKNGKADIEKAIHYLELILELQYGE